MTATLSLPEGTYLSLSRADRWARSLLFSRLALARTGVLEARDADGLHRFGRETADHDRPARIDFLDPATYRRAIAGGTIGAGESFAEGMWESPDLTAVCRFFVVNRDVMNGMDGGFWGLFKRGGEKALHFLRSNTLTGSRRNIQAHYDLGNDFFQLFLDDTWTYSSGLFEAGQENLQAAQVAKIDRLCRKLRLTPQDHLLEIGTGWGALALHAAKNYGCRVTTTTISRAQHDAARERIDQAGLAERVTLLFEDYRRLTGSYDKLVSVEMIEAVGLDNLPAYFRKVASLLKPDGAAAVQAITIRDQFYAQARRSVDFIQKHIFPGSGIPAVTAMMEAVRDASDLRLVHLEDFGPHYGRTLKAWHERLLAARPEAERRGYGLHLQRLWRYYFSYCEAGFIERQVGVSQLLFAKPENRMEPLLGGL